MTVHLANTPTLETDRLILRAPQASDLDPSVAFLMESRAEFIGGPYSKNNAWQTMGTLIGHWVLRGYGLFVFCDKTSGKPLGTSGPLFPQGWAEPELGWSIWTSETEGKGYAYEATKAARDWAYSALGWKTAVSYIDPKNDRSIALAKRLGALIDRDAALPNLPDWTSTSVYRHPSAEALS